MKPLLVLAGTVAAVAVAVVGPVGLAFGAGHWWCGAVGFCIALMPAVATLWLTLWFMRQSPYGMLLGLAVGTAVRLAATLGIAFAVFAAARSDGEWAAVLGHPLRFWLWVLVGYLAAMTVETVLLVRAAPPHGRLETGG